MSHKRVEPKIVLFLSVVLAIQFGCTKQENSTVYVKTKLAPVTNVRAFSASGSTVGLQWEPSADRGKNEFGSVKLVVTDENQNVIYPGIVISKDRSDTTVVGLNEGNVHTFEFTSIPGSDQVYGESDPVRIQWASASRFPIDPDSIVVSEYRDTVVTLSGLQFFNTDAGAYGPRLFRTDDPLARNRIDVFLREDPNSNGTVYLLSSHLPPVLGVNTTKFSNIEILAPSMNVARATPPASSTYTLDRIVLAPSTVTSGKVFFAVTKDTNYVRIYVKRDPVTGALVGGTRPNRKISLQISYQTKPKVIYAKPRNESRNGTVGSR